jgi:hypothetical protein
VNTEAAVFKYLKRKLPQVDWQRIEAWVGAGVPDVNGAFLWPPEGQQQAFEIWCELKVCKLKTFKTEGLWRPAQIAYITRRSCVIGNVWNLVSHPRAEVLYIYSGDKTPLLSTDSTGSTDPDLVLPFDEPWTTALDLFASRQVRQVRPIDPIDPTDSIDPPACRQRKTPPSEGQAGIS